MKLMVLVENRIILINLYNRSWLPQLQLKETSLVYLLQDLKVNRLMNDEFLSFLNHVKQMDNVLLHGDDRNSQRMHWEMRP